MKLHRLLGAVLIAFALLPLYRLLDSPDSGLAGAATIRMLDLQYDFVWAGLLLVVPVAALGALLLAVDVMQRMISTVSARLVRLRTISFALLLALAAGSLAGLFVLLVLKGMPNHIDSIAQLMQARFWAHGNLAGPVADHAGFWSIQNALFTPHGWVSQYPPGHVLVLTPFVLLGAPWLAGPVLVAATVFFATLLAHQLFPEKKELARLLALLVALSPFFVMGGASFMNHVTAAAAVMAGAYALARAWNGRLTWALAAGLAFGLAIATRPLSSAAMTLAISAFLPFAVARGPRAAEFIRVGGCTLLGLLAPLTGLFAYNQHFFGSATRFGYQAALGPNMRLGFHTDPWGNFYGFKQALAYTSSEMLALGVNLFEAALSSLLLIGVFLLLAKRITPAQRLLLAWALAPVLVNFFYWHHGQFMGPRMLHESAPAWAMLTGIAGVQLVSSTPLRSFGNRLNLRTAVFTAVAGSLAFGILVLSPQRALSYGGDWMALTRAPLPHVERPALVFVHDAWSARIGMTLAASGYRLDTVETLLRQNSTCAVHELAAAIASGDQPAAQRLLAQLDTVPRATSVMRVVEIAPDDRIRIRGGETPTPACIREARSDRAGILDLAPYLWRGDLPGSAARGALFVRDLGPARNARLIAAHPDRQPFVYAASGERSAQLYAYEDGIRRLWGEP